MEYEEESVAVGEQMFLPEERLSPSGHRGLWNGFA